MCSPGGVPGGEGDCVPAESGSGEAPGGRLAVLPAPSDRELQTAVERRSSCWVLHRQTQRWDGRQRWKVGAAFLGGAVCSFHPVNILQLCLSPAGSPSQSCFLISINGPRCLQRVQRRRSQSKTFLFALFTHTVKQMKAVSVMPLPHLSLKDAVNCKCV